MRKWIEVISFKIGFTKTEIKIILFLLCAFLLGLLVKHFKDTSNDSSYLEFDYSLQDSLFNAALGNIDLEDSVTVDTLEKRVASKNKLLDFGTSKTVKLEVPNKKSSPKVININTAGIAELTSLPGIGLKTAQNIIAFRKEKGNFAKSEQLLKIKGIGSAKLAKIRGYIKFE